MAKRQIKVYKELLEHLGLALSIWADVEDELFQTFRALMGRIPKDICSIVFFSIPSFEGKRTLCDRLADLCLEHASAREWQKLSKKLMAGASARGKMAHYRVDVEMHFPNFSEAKEFQISAASLRPSPHNYLQSGKMRTSSSVMVHTDLVTHIRDFNNLRAAVSLFRINMTRKKDAEINDQGEGARNALERAIGVY